MDAKDYLTKVASICKEYDSRGCMNGNCPLRDHSCGAPLEPEEIEEIMQIVEAVDLSTLFPYGRCEKCGYKFNYELINEYEIKYCPKCGKKIR